MVRYLRIRPLKGLRPRIPPPTPFEKRSRFFYTRKRITRKEKGNPFRLMGTALGKRKARTRKVITHTHGKKARTHGKKNIHAERQARTRFLSPTRTVVPSTVR